MTENRIIARQPTPPPSGRTSTLRPIRMALAASTGERIDDVGFGVVPVVVQ